MCTLKDKNKQKKKCIDTKLNDKKITTYDNIIQSHIIIWCQMLYTRNKKKKKNYYQPVCLTTDYIFLFVYFHI